MKISDFFDFIKPGEGHGAFFAEKSRKFLSTGAGRQIFFLPAPVLRKIREFFAKNAPFPSPGLMKIEKSLKCVSPRTRIFVKVLFPLSGEGEKLFFAETDLHEKAFCPLPGQRKSGFNANPGPRRRTFE